MQQTRTASRVRTDKERELSWIFRFNKAKRFVNLAQSDFLPAAIHLSAILTPKLLISLNLSPSVTILDWLLMFGCSNCPFFPLFSLTPFHWLTNSCCLLTDRSLHERHEVSCEWIWMESSICPSAIRLHWHWMLTELSERLKRIWKWSWCEWGSNIFQEAQGKSSQPEGTVSGTFIPSANVWCLKY